MTAPGAAAGRFLSACLLGVGLGVVYAFLRPPRQKHPHLSDTLFLLALFPAWIYLGFGICGGDLRLGYTAGLFLGTWAGAATLGRLLQPLFCFLWKILTFPLHLLKKFFKKMKKIAKKLLASGKKWFTMKKNMGKSQNLDAGGTDYDAV